jgi:hypothetical protein
MKTQKGASLEARIKNSKDLIIIIKDLAQYDPTSEDLKIENYERFVDEVDESITPLKNAKGYLADARKQARHAFRNLVKVSRNIQSEVDEMRSASSDEYTQVRNVVKLITGENVREHTLMKKRILAGLKNGEDPPKFSSVSQLDYKSMLGNFRELFGILTTFGFYAPSDSSLSMESLAAFEVELAAKIENITEKETDYANERSRIIHYFTDEHGLNDRAKRAKKHIKRKYGVESPEYKLVTYKKF